MRASVTFAGPIAFLSALRMSMLSWSDPVQKLQVCDSTCLGFAIPCLLLRKCETQQSQYDIISINKYHVAREVERRERGQRGWWGTQSWMMFLRKYKSPSRPFGMVAESKKSPPMKVALLCNAVRLSFSFQTFLASSITCKHHRSIEVK